MWKKGEEKKKLIRKINILLLRFFSSFCLKRKRKNILVR